MSAAMDRIEKALAKARGNTSGPANGDIEAPIDNGGRSDGRATAPLDAVSADRERLIALNFGHPAADLFRILRAQVFRALRSADKSTLGICSARPGEGKTFTAANLAASMALSPEQPVLLVDLDLKRPSAHGYFHTEPSPGVTDFLSGTMSIMDCIRPTDIKGLELLASGKPILNSSEALGSAEVIKRFNEIRRRNPRQLIIYDLPPMLVSDDVLAFSSEIDAIIFIIEEGRTKLGEMQRALDLIPRDKLIGTILNKSRGNNPFPYSPYYSPDGDHARV